MNKFLIAMGRAALVWVTVFIVATLLTLGQMWVKASYIENVYNMDFVIRLSVMTSSLCALGSLVHSLNKEFK